MMERNDTKVYCSSVSENINYYFRLVSRHPCSLRSSPHCANVGLKMSKINDQAVNDAARMVRVAIEPAKLHQYSQHLESILDYVEQLSKIDTREVPPNFQVSGLINVFRDDVVTNHNMRDQLLANTPSHENGLIKVRAVRE